MRKQDFVHLHALLALTTRFLLERGDLLQDGLESYESLGTRPSDIHASKRAHRAAVLELSRTNADALEAAAAPGPLEWNGTGAAEGGVAENEAVANPSGRPSTHSSQDRSS